FEMLKVNLVPEKSLDKNLHLNINFKDSSKSFSLILRQGVLEVQPFKIDGSDVQVETTEFIWKEIVSGTRSLPVSLATRQIKVSGDKVSLISFFSAFKE
ncbi:uncharacterized protein METZ01_LOCUS385618, partial [marine metagenome]